MDKTELTKEQVKEELESKLSRYFGVSSADAGKTQVYRATILNVKDILAQKRAAFKEKVKRQKGKSVYYLCMEFLIGPSLKNNLLNLGCEHEYREALTDMGYDIDEFYFSEPDPGLGNGGLGRLAACFLDSLTTLGYPATGFSLCYEYGLFKQKIIDGNQVELPDMWMQQGGEGWLAPRPDKTFPVRFGGEVREHWENGKLTIVHEHFDEVSAVPYDMHISGYHSDTVNKLRLWRAHSTTDFNMNLFSQGQYEKAIQESSRAEVITKVLYPSDEHDEGKLLRLSQQYFLVSASLQSIISDHLRLYGTLYNFADKVAIHINDTHPALCIPELMRILMDVYSYSWENAWDVVRRTVSYTNHTVMPEALECWRLDLVRVKLPRISMIIEEINKRLCTDLWNLYPGDWDRISRLSVVAYNQVRMANLSVAASHTVNGVSKLHSNILTKSVFRDYYKAYPEKFTNVTNGIVHRRWLCYSNPQLTALLDECIGDAYKTDSCRLADFLKFKDDASVANQLEKIKSDNKIRLSKYLFSKHGMSVDDSALLDVQVKRIHEYKRQLLNVLKIIAYYNELKENPNADVQPCTFIFGGKAAPGYYFAKDIIRLIWSLGEEIRRDPLIRQIINVVYVEEYNVSTAEMLFPASDISEQISLAGKEASGTGCMKFMINGALTIGTLDGANVEMRNAVGDDNIYIFGLHSDEVDSLWKSGYESMKYYRDSPRLKSAVDRLSAGFSGNSFDNITNYLLYSHGVSDPYMCLADFDSYFNASERIRSAYCDKEAWYRKSISNIAAAGYFSADRSINEYAANIWHIDSVK